MSSIIFYLGIHTNIVCVNDREKFNEEDAIYLSPYFKKDYSATLYLGKIIFKQEKDFLIPEYIPSKINEKSFENLNLFWLNEANLNYKPRGQEGIEYGTDVTMFYMNRKYFKSLYYKSQHNITLNKEQIISYFTELHTKNTQFIQAYIDEINKNKGIKAYTNIESYYDKLAKEGIIPPKLLSKYNDGTYKQNNEADLIVLDYLKSNNEANSMILLNDELFYDDLKWSLKEFLISDDDGNFQDNIGLILNAGAYKNFQSKEDIRKIISKNNIVFFLDSPHLTADDIYSLKFPQNQYSSSYNEFSMQKYGLFSPNILFYTDEIISSPLGNYYFELEQDRGVYIEYFQRIYPSITNPPKAWTKEMMKKLDLELE